MTTEELLKRYSVSYYQDKSCGGWFDANDLAKESGRPDHPGLINVRAVGGYSVPIADGRELVALMVSNVEECRLEARHTAHRLNQAKRDGLLNMKAFKQEDEETQEKWLACIHTVRGDYQRAVSEMKHWQDYAERASNGTLPVLKDNRASGIALIRQLADMKSFPPDPRLPPEHDEDAVLS